MTRIAFLGLGGVGGYFGAKLARYYADSADVEILFLARQETADHIRAHGIQLITPEEEFTTYPHRIAAENDAGVPADFLLCSVKSYDLEESLLQFSHFIGPKTIIIPLQNGIDAVHRVKQKFPENETWDACVYIVSRIVSRGIIRETGNIHSLHFGSNTGDPVRLQEFYSLVKAAHDDVFFEKDIHEVVWKKYIFISVVASLTSYLDVCLGKILEHESSRKMLLALLEEITIVAGAEKIPLSQDIISTTVAKMERLPYETTSSMHSDFKAGKRTELNSLTAHVVKLAELHGIGVPCYKTVLRGLRIRQN